MRASGPRVTLGVPVYNGERFLRETLESLRAQTFSDFEMVISDNASTDGTEEIAREVAAADERVRYVRQRRNKGLAANYNDLFRVGTGEYFKWASSDDPCEPRFLERCVAMLDADPGAVLAYCRARFIDERGAELPEHDRGFPLDFEPGSERLRYIIRADHWVNAILGVIRREALGATRLLPNYPGGDYALLGELSVQGRFVETPEALLRRRLHGAASSQLADDPHLILTHVTGGGGTSVPLWLRLRDHARTILGADLPLGRKLGLLTFLAGQAGRRRTRLIAEARRAVRARLSAGGGDGPESEETGDGLAPRGRVEPGTASDRTP